MSELADLVIVGAGGHGRETLGIVQAINALTPTWNIVGFVADDPDVDCRVERLGHRIVGTSHWLATQTTRPAPHYVLGIGNPATRAQLDAQLTDAGLQAATLIHPAASIGPDNQLGPGVLIAAGAVVTTNVSLGRHVHLNVNAVVSHDCTVGDHCSLSPGTLLNGTVTVGERTMLGSAAVVTPQRTVGSDVTVGAGAVVVEDIPDAVTVKGVPAR